MAAKRKVWLIQQSVWRTNETAQATMPLAIAYLKAVVDADPGLKADFDARLFNFAGDEPVALMLGRLFGEEIPDILAFSVFGWNVEPFLALSETFKQINPHGTVIWGGTHVTHQEEKTFRRTNAVDIIINGEGERTWADLLPRLASTRDASFLAEVKGISFRTEGVAYQRNEARERIEDLDEIPSPYLLGTMPLSAADGSPLYPYALMETNRGCPYACAFCYWGGAIGQKVRSFSLERLAAELEVVAKAGYAEIMLCDANFGMLEADEEFIELFISMRERYGAPQHLFTSWAKNKGKVFGRAMRRMREAGMQSAFNLALQSMSEDVLTDMGRKNMKINAWEALADTLHQDGYDVYGELIWGCPGETVESFLDGYDRLARRVKRIAIYPLLIMPNTDYSDKRSEYELVTYRPGGHDFELVLAHRTMTVADNRQMHRFLFWARMFAEHLVFRYIFDPLYVLGGLTQSQVLLSFDAWIDGAESETAAALRQIRQEVVDTLEVSSQALERALRALYLAEDIEELFECWWREAMDPNLPSDWRAPLFDVLRLDVLTMPAFDGTARSTARAPVSNDDGSLVSSSTVRFATDPVALCDAVREERVSRADRPHGSAIMKASAYRLVFEDGFSNDMQLYHAAHNLKFFGKPVPDFERTAVDGNETGDRKKAALP